MRATVGGPGGGKKRRRGRRPKRKRDQEQRDESPAREGDRDGGAAPDKEEGADIENQRGRTKLGPSLAAEDDGGLDGEEDDNQRRKDMLYGPQRTKTPKRRSKKATRQLEEAKQEEKRGKRARAKAPKEDGEDGPSRQERKSVQPKVANDKWSDESDPESDGDFKNVKKKETGRAAGNALDRSGDDGIAVSATDKTASHMQRMRTGRSDENFVSPLTRLKTTAPGLFGSGVLGAPARGALDTSQDLPQQRSTDLPGLGLPNVNLALAGLGTATHAN